MMKASELRNSSNEELLNELNSLYKEQFNLRMMAGSGQPVRADLFNKVKRNIARVKTIMTEKSKESLLKEDNVNE